MHRKALLLPSVLALAFAAAVVQCSAESDTPAGYQELVALFEDWRAFERPATKDGAPDYTAAAMAKKHRAPGLAHCAQQLGSLGFHEGDGFDVFLDTHGSSHVTSFEVTTASVPR